MNGHGARILPVSTVLAKILSSAVLLALPPGILVGAYLTWVRLPSALAEHDAALASYVGYALATSALVVLPAVLITALRRWVVRDVVHVSLFVGWVLFGCTLLVLIIMGGHLLPPWRDSQTTQTFVFVSGFPLLDAAALAVTSVAASNGAPARRLRLLAALSTVPLVFSVLLVAVDPNMPWLR